MSLILDASVALAWTLPDERTAVARAVLERILRDGAIAPALLHWEFRNGLRSAERRGRLSAESSAAAIVNFNQFPIELRRPFPSGRDLEIARDLGLSIYDAAYLELALREHGELATLDRRLAAVAARSQVLAPECASLASGGG